MWSLFVDQFLHRCPGGYNKKKYNKLVAGGWVKLLFSSGCDTS